MIWINCAQTVVYFKEVSYNSQWESPQGFRSDEVGEGKVDEDGEEGDEEEGGVGDLAEDKEHEADDDHLQWP